MEEIRELIINLNRGSERAFEEIYSLYFNKIVYFSYRYTNDYTKSKCIAQEVFISLWENRENIDVNRNILSYLLTIAKNKTINILKREMLGKRYSMEVKRDLEQLNIGALCDDSCSELIANELSGKLRKILDRMPDKTREMFLMSRSEGLKYEQIAIKTGVSVKMVEYRIMQALKIIRRYITFFVFIF